MISAWWLLTIPFVGIPGFLFGATFGTWREWKKQWARSDAYLQLKKFDIARALAMTLPRERRVPLLAEIEKKQKEAHKDD